MTYVCIHTCMDSFRYRHHTDTHIFTFIHIHTQDGGTCPESVWKTLRRERIKRAAKERENERQPKRQALSAPRFNFSEKSHEMLVSCVEKALYNRALLLRNCFHVRCDLEGEKNRNNRRWQRNGRENTFTHVHTHTYTHSLTLTHVCMDSPNPFLRVEKEGDVKL